MGSVPPVGSGRLCVHGHLIEGDNAIERYGHNGWDCRQCHRDQQKRYAERIRARRQAAKEGRPPPPLPAYHQRDVDRDRSLLSYPPIKDVPRMKAKLGVHAIIERTRVEVWRPDTEMVDIGWRIRYTLHTCPACGSHDVRREPGRRPLWSCWACPWFGRIQGRVQERDVLDQPQSFTRDERAWFGLDVTNATHVECA